MADLVCEGGSVDEEELAVLEKSGVLASRKSKGKGKARSMSGPKHIVFVEEGEGMAVFFAASAIDIDCTARYLRKAFEPRPCPSSQLHR